MLAAMSLVALFKPNGPSGFGFRSTAEDVTRGLSLRGKTILITGSNSGIGLETVRVLALRGAHVLAAARTEDKARAACAGFAGEIVPLACELSEPRSVRACVAAVQRLGAKLDAVVCNAGIMALPRLEQAFGYELQFFTNHIGHFLLVTGLLNDLADNGRVVMLSSAAHARAPRGVGIEFDNLSGQQRYDPWVAYGQSKLANLLFAKELAKRLAGTRKTANAVHPGVINTNLARSRPLIAFAMHIAEPIGFKSIAQGAATQCYVATHPKLEGVTGEYFADCNVARSTRRSRDAELAARLWAESERIVAELPGT